MRKIIVLSMISLDGVLQAPGGPEEDRSGGFQFGGWSAPFGDDEYGKAVQEEMKPAEYLLGRKTFDIWENYWPEHADSWPAINDGMKYVLSRTRNQTSWKNSAFLEGLEDIKQLKASEGPDLNVWGSSELIHLLLENDLIDEMWLKIHPIILGQGKKLFAEEAKPSAYKMTGNTVTSTGVILARYVKEGEVQTGNAGVKR